jgi:hypothetical protein
LPKATGGIVSFLALGLNPSAQIRANKFATTRITSQCSRDFSPVFNANKFATTRITSQCSRDFSPVIKANKSATTRITSQCSRDFSPVIKANKSATTRITSQCSRDFSPVFKANKSATKKVSFFLECTGLPVLCYMAACRRIIVLRLGAPGSSLAIPFLALGLNPSAQILKG